MRIFYLLNFLVTLLSISFYSCSKNYIDEDFEDTSNNTPGEEIKLRNVTITVSNEGEGNSSSRTVHTEDGWNMKVTWKKGDKIYIGIPQNTNNIQVNYTNSGFYTFSINNESDITENGKKAVFQGAIPESWTTDDKLLAFYGNAGNLKVYLDDENKAYVRMNYATQNYNNHEVILNNYDMMTASTSLKSETELNNITFEHENALLKLTLDFGSQDLIIKNIIIQHADKTKGFVSYLDVYKDGTEVYTTYQPYYQFNTAKDSYVKPYYNDNGKAIIYRTMLPTNTTDGNGLYIIATTGTDGTGPKYYGRLSGLTSLEKGKYYVAPVIKMKQIDIDTSTNEINISSADDLVDIATLINTDELTTSDKTLNINKDIDLTGKVWIPIWNFKGTLQCTTGVTISNLNCVMKDGGLFGNIEGATIDGVKISNGNITGKSEYTGGIVAKAKKSTIMNCEFNGSVVTSVTEDINEQCFASGIVGSLEGNSTCENCTNNGTINMKYAKSNSYSAGIVGKTTTNSGETISIKNCTNNGTITYEADTNVKSISAFVGNIPSRSGTINIDNYTFGTESNPTQDVSGSIVRYISYYNYNKEDGLTIDYTINITNDQGTTTIGKDGITNQYPKY